MSPGILVAVLLVLIGAQLTRLAVPGRGHYLLALACAAVGLVVGEVVALSGHGGPTLGAVHPLADGVAIAVLETCALLLLPRGRAARR